MADATTEAPMDFFIIPKEDIKRAAERAYRSRVIRVWVTSGLWATVALEDGRTENVYRHMIYR